MWFRKSGKQQELKLSQKIASTPRRSPRFKPEVVGALEDRALMSAGLHAHVTHAHHQSTPLHVETNHSRRPAPPRFQQTNLVSDGSTPAVTTDVKLKNPWGLAASATGPWWFSDNGSGLSTLYNGKTGATPPLVVNIASPKAATGGTPTGIVFNQLPAGSTGGYPFVFSTEDGTIIGWAPGANSASSTVLVDNSASGAVYKGLATDTNSGNTYYYATNFNSGKVEVYDAKFASHTFSASQFTDSRIPAGYAPFGIQNVNGAIYVTYAQQDSAKHDNVSGRGLGFVDKFSSDGTLIARVGARGALNAPWGLAQAPSTFGRFSGDLLVGNFGDGRINAFKQGSNGRFRFDGTLRNAQAQPISIDGLWGIATGNDASAGSSKTLFFTAGPNDEKNGLFGSITRQS